MTRSSLLPVLFLLLAMILGSLLVGRGHSEAGVWSAFVLVALGIAAHSLWGHVSRRRPREAVDESRSGSVASWLRHLERAKRSEFAKWELARELTRLTWGVLGDGEPLAFLESERDWRN